MGRILDPGRVFEDLSGNLLAGGTVTFYTNGTATLKSTYSDAALTIENSNPVTIGSDGRLLVEVFGTGTYTIRADDANGAGAWSEDDIRAQNESDADGVTYNQGGTGAEDWTLKAKFQAERVSVLDFMTAAQRTDVTTAGKSVDVSGAIQEAVTAIMSNGGGKLYLPKGDYYIGSLVTTTVDLGDGDEKGLTLEGDGRGVTVIRIKNSTGFFSWVQASARDINLTIRDMTIKADNAGSAGAAFTVSSVAGGNHHHRDLVVENVMGLPEDPLVDYFDYFFKTNALWRPYFHNVSTSGPFAGASEATQKLGTACFDVSESYGPHFENCFAWGCTYGYYYNVAENPGGEGGEWHKCVADSDIGWYIASAGNEPGGRLHKCHANCNTAGVQITNKRLIWISECLFYGEETDPYEDVELINCDDIYLKGNTYFFGGNTSRTGVSVDASCTNIFIEDEKFKADGTAISLASGCDGIHILRPWFDSAVDTPITDSGATNLFVHHLKRYYCTAYLGTAQSIANSTESPVVWKDTLVDLGEWFDGDDERIIVPSNLGIRKVRVSANVLWATNDTQSRVMRITKNGATLPGGPSLTVVGEATNRMNIVSGVLEVADGDIFRLLVTQDTGGALNVGGSNLTWMSVEAIDG